MDHLLGPNDTVQRLGFPHVNVTTVFHSTIIAKIYDFLNINRLHVGYKFYSGINNISEVIIPLIHTIVCVTGMLI